MLNPKTIKAYALKNAIEHNGKAQPGSVIAGLFNHGLKKENIKTYIQQINKTINEVNQLSKEQQSEQFQNLQQEIGKRKTRQGLKPLRNAKIGKVIMRFAPSPSGPMHIGHALTSSISYLYTQKYKGKFYVRIEDTNPENIYPPAYKMLEQEAKWLFNNKAKIIIQSDHIPIYYKYIEKLLKLKKVYICTCNQENFKAKAKEKKNCPCRKIKDQKERWNKMLDKTKKGYHQGEAVLRFKTSMKHKNPAFRDFPLARINTTTHPLQKNKYKVWPLMNLSVTIDDIEQKMTHIIRAKDHRDNSEKQKLIYKALKKKPPISYFLGRIHLKDMELSSSKMRQDIEQGKYTGWDDKRLFTIASLKKQNYKPIAFHKLAEQIGLNEVDKTLDKKEFFLLLNNFNNDKNK